MIKKIVPCLLLIAVLSAEAKGDISAGESKSVVCAACHGEKGVSVNPEWPNLAGQHATYLSKQLRDFKRADTRHAATMTPMTSGLSDQDMDDLSVFYASQPALLRKKTTKDKARGKQLYERGDVYKHITACTACHGPDGTGNAQAGFPVLAGQNASYTIQQLQAFKEETRQNDLNAIMRTISQRLDAADMQAVAEYLACLPN